MREGKVSQGDSSLTTKTHIYIISPYRSMVCYYVSTPKNSPFGDRQGSPVLEHMPVTQPAMCELALPGP